MLSVIAGYDARDGATLQVPVADYAGAARPGSLKGLRVGLPRGYFDAKLEAEVAAVLHAAAEVYRGLGAEVLEVQMPDLDAVNGAGFMLNWGDVLTIHTHMMQERGEDYTPQTRGRLAMTLCTSARDYVDAQRYRAVGLRDFCDTVFSKCDALLAPILSFPVPRLSEVDVAGGPNMMRIMDEITRLMRPVNTLGLPALAVPSGFTPNGLPCGMQLIARPFAERLLYRIGAAYQGATDWHTRMPAAAT